MNNKALGLALAAVVAAPAAFAQSSVTLYGRAAMALDNYSASGGTNPNSNFKSRWRVNDIASRVGLRGVEDLGGGLRAIFVIETGVNIDNGSNTGQSGLANASTGFWASRDSFVGLEGASWGRVTMGRQSVYWNTNQFPAHAAFGWMAVDGASPGAGIQGRGNPATIARQNNVLQYQTPAIGGAYARLSYSPTASNPGSATSIANGEAAQAGLNTNSRLLGASLIGNWGPIGANLDWATTQPSTDTAGAIRQKTTHYKAGLGWRYSPTGNFGIVFTRTDTNHSNITTLGDKTSQDALSLSWDHAFGNIVPMATASIQRDIKGCDAPAAANCKETGMKSLGVGVRYLFSKRTWASVYAAKTRNESQGNADWGAGGQTSQSPPGASIGADPRVIGMLIYHDF